MRTRWPRIVICVALGLGFNTWLAYHCLFKQWGPGPPWLAQSAQTYWDRYADRSAEHGAAMLAYTSGAVGCDFLVIDASRADIGDAAPPRMMITRAGFPFRCFEGMHSWGPVTPAYSWAIPITPRCPNVAWLSVIPYRPLPLGLLLNTALYASVAWVVIFGPVDAYRRMQADHRRRLNCCHRCGYDLRAAPDAGCPECGWRR